MTSLSLSLSLSLSISHSHLSLPFPFSLSISHSTISFCFALFSLLYRQSLPSLILSPLSLLLFMSLSFSPVLFLYMSHHLSLNILLTLSLLLWLSYLLFLYLICLQGLSPLLPPPPPPLFPPTPQKIKMAITKDLFYRFFYSVKVNDSFAKAQFNCQNFINTAQSTN